MIAETDVNRFAKLFRANDRSHGVFHPQSGAMETLHRPITMDDYRKHLDGVTGLGAVPILDDHTCWFGVIDVDTPDDEPSVDLEDLEQRIQGLGLPLVLCRSKSGDAHLYCFGAEPLPAKLLRATLKKWAAQLGHSGCEVFPKQDTLGVDDDGTRMLGNWINLCWFDASNPKGLRYMVEGGKRRSFSYFLEVAESRRVTAAKLVEQSDDEHGEAPPCIRSMIANGVRQGSRNEALYNVVVYLKRAYPEGWRDKAFDLNAKMFDQPLDFAEAKKTISSAGRRDYRYKCKEEPCRSLCRSSICVTRKYGITAEEKGELEMGKPPEFGPLEKIMTDPPRWVLKVDGDPVTVTTVELMDFRHVRVAVADKSSRLIAPMKNDRWQAILHGLMENVIERAAPDEASPTGLIKSHLMQFFQRTDLTSSGEDVADRQHLLLGSPVVQVHPQMGEKCVYFRGPDFIDYLKKNRAEELKGPNLWVVLRTLGVEHSRLRINGKVVPVWFYVLDEDVQVELADQEIGTEF